MIILAVVAAGVVGDAGRTPAIRPWLRDRGAQDEALQATLDAIAEMPDDEVAVRVEQLVSAAVG